MSKKQRMLDHITNNVKWFLSTDTSIEVIPYYDMSNTVFSKAKECLVSGYVDPDEVVCLVSTSVMEPGKTGVLFTTDSMYCKSWGLFTTKYHNYYFAYEYAQFDRINDFYEDRMKELMKDLNDISVKEDEKEQFNQKINEIVDMGKKVGTAALGGMALLDVIASIGDIAVSQNNDKIANEIAKLENSDDQETVNVITIYKEFIPLVNQFVDVCVKVEEEGDNISEDTCYSIISILNNLLVKLYNQTLDNIDISPDDEEEYGRFGNWLSFWSLLFYDGDQFRETYPIELLVEMPACWDVIIGLMDELVQNVWEESFSGTVHVFSETIVNNSVKILELMGNDDWDEELIESIGECIESNNQAVKSLKDVLDKATDYLQELLPVSE